MREDTRTLTAPRVRCAIYTRKSTEEGLDQEFNSLDAQREAGEAFIASQRHEGWTVIPSRYDDGGFSGGSMDRPALERLLLDVERGRIDCVVVYKVDRLSRSLLDFAKIIEVFDRNKVSFVSVTQQFNTSTSMGRLVLNVLLSFAQFEREIIGERIRDKVAGAKRKGKFTGGTPPLGYDVDPERTALIVNPEEAKTVRFIFKRFAELGAPLRICKELDKKGITTKAWMTKQGVFREGRKWTPKHIYRIIYNRTYLGEVSHRGKHYPGEHEAIITPEMWQKAHAVLEEGARTGGRPSCQRQPALLRGIIRCGVCDSAMSPITSHNGSGKLYRYYKCGHASRHGQGSCPVNCVPAGDIETAVIQQLRGIFRAPEMIAETYRAAQQMEVDNLNILIEEQADLERRSTALREASARLFESGNVDTETADDIRRTNEEFVALQHRLGDIGEDIQSLKSSMVSEQEVADALRKLDPIWDELYPVEQARVTQLLIEKVKVNTDGLQIRLRSNGLHSIVSELGDVQDRRKEDGCPV